MTDRAMRAITAAVDWFARLGDASMVAGGLPEPRADHAQAVAEMALDMLGELDALCAALDFGLQLRIGIASGPVIAGVIGRQKFNYDLWGDTVNTASRMGPAACPAGSRSRRRRTGPCAIGSVSRIGARST